MRYLLLTALIGAIAYGPGYCEENISQLDAVVVTASRIPEAISKTPATTQVISEDEVDKVKYRNVEEILRRLPGIYSLDLGGEEELTSIRIPTNFSNPYTLLLIDGLPATGYGESAGALFREINSGDIEKIEVLKGPASAMYGSNAIGGVINVITRSPEKKGGKIWAEVGDYAQYRSGVYDRDFSDRFSYVVGADWVQAEGRRENAAREKKAANFKTNYYLTDASMLAFKCDAITLDNELAGSLDADDFERNWIKSEHRFASVESDKISPAITYTHDLQAGEFKTSLLMISQNETTNPTYGIRYVPPPAGPAYTSTLTKSDELDLIWQTLCRRDFKFLGARLIAGMDVEKDRNRSDLYRLNVDWDEDAGVYSDYQVAGMSGSYDIDVWVTAPYVQFEIQPIDRFSIQFGARYDSINLDATDRLKRADQDKSFSRMSPKMGVIWEAADKISVYASYSHGFVAPTAGQLFTSSSANEELTPEKAVNYEAGLRGNFFESRLSLDLALYWMEIEDKIVVRTVDPVTRQRNNINAGRTTHKGAELIATVAPIEKFSVTAAYGYALNQYDVYASSTGEDYSGNDMPRSPEHRLNLRLSVFPIQGLTMELEMDAVSTQYIDDANAYGYSRPTLFHFRTQYDWKSWSFWGYVANLGDVRYASYVSDSSGPSYYPGSSRTIFAGISYQWGK